jgi:hypothetical protein
MIIPYQKFQRAGLTNNIKQRIRYNIEELLRENERMDMGTCI